MDAHFKQILENALNGDSHAQNQIGEYYYFFEEDYAQAMKYFNMAVANGNSAAHFGIAMMYQLGNGVEMDLERARECITIVFETSDGKPSIICLKIYMGSKRMLN